MKTIRWIIAAIIILSWTHSGLCEEGRALHLPENLLIIKEEAFAGADGFTEAVLPEGITEIGARAFADSSLVSIHLPASLTFIDDTAFDGCENLIVTAEEGSYAYGWCAERGLIVPGLQIGLCADAQSAWTGETVAWTASVSGAAEPVSCLLTLSRNGETILSAELTPDTPYETIFEQGGLYAACLTVSDAKGTEASAETCIYLFDGERPTGLALTQTGCSSASLTWSGAAGEDVRLYLLYAEAADGEFTDYALLEGDGYLTLDALPRNQLLTFAIEARAEAAAADGTPLSFTDRSEPCALTLLDAQYDYAVSGEACSIEGAQLWPDSPTTCLSVPAQIDGYPVVKIGHQAFTRSSTITSVTLPDSVTSVASTAFYGCTALESVDLGASVVSIGSFAFAECESLSSVRLSPALTVIGDRAFQNDAQLTELILPGRLTSIGSKALNGTGVSALHLPASLSEIGAQALGGDLKTLFVDADSSYFVMHGGLLYSRDLDRLVCAPAGSVGSEYSAPDALVSIDASVFEGHTALTRVVLSENTASIGESTFKNCTALTSVAGAQSLASIGDEAFRGCTALKDDLFSGMTSLNTIGSYAFSGCTSLNAISLPESLNTLEPAAFYGCTALESVALPGEMSAIGAAAFYGCTSLQRAELPDRLTGSDKLGGYVFYGCTSLESISIPMGVTAVSEYCFHGCSALTSVTLPDGLLAVSKAAFFSCHALTDISIPDSVSTISAYAFANNFALPNLTLPSCSAGSYAFGACRSLESVTFYGNTALTLASNAFYGCQKLSAVYLPDRIASISSTAFEKSDLATLYVTEGSAAQRYLNANGFAYQLKQTG